MSAQPNYFRIGLFIVIGTAIATAGLVAFGAGQFFKKRIIIETYVNSSVQGVDKGSPVKYRGLLVGAVKRITFAFDEYSEPDRPNKGAISDPNAPNEGDHYNYVVILMEIDKQMFPGMFSEDLTKLIEQNVKQGLRARIEPLGITGMNYVDINYLKEMDNFPLLGFSWTPEHYYIPSAPGQLASILDSVNSMMSQVSGMMDELKKLNLGDVQSGISQLLNNLNKAVTGADLEKLSADMQALMAEVNKAVADAKVGELSADARSLISELQRSNDDLQKILKNIEPATRFDPAEVRAIVNNLADVTKNLESFSYSVKKRPSVLLWGSPAKPPESKPEKKRSSRRDK